MKFEKLIARNGQETLKINNIFLYSKYKPFEDAEKFIEKEIDYNASGYLLVGLGLGYHLKALQSIVDKNKQILVFLIDSEELSLFKASVFFADLSKYPNIKIVKEISDLLVVNSDFQLIIPHVWMQVMDSNHPLYPFLLDIKTKQMSYKRFSLAMEENFHKNKLLNDFNLLDFFQDFRRVKTACLVSSGPSLEITMHWLNDIQKENVFILSVGSALRPLLKNNIVPDAVIISDSQDEILNQLIDSNYEGYLFYLCTANHETVLSHQYKRCILLQNGYKLAENLARQINYPLLDTGGSVATTAYSLLTYLQVVNIILFGQDLGFSGNNTHVTESTSGRIVNNQEKLHKIMSNRNELISTTPNLLSYLNWFEKTIRKSTLNVYNTAVDGAKIKGVPLVNKEEFLTIIN